MAEHDGEEIKNHEAGGLPAVESPPLSPAGASSDQSDQHEDDAPAVAAAKGASRLSLSRRTQRRVTLMAWLALVAGLGALFGGAISNGLADRHATDVAGAKQQQAMQQSIDQLTRQVSALKASLAKSAAVTHSQIAKISARVDRQPDRIVTGSIPATRAEPVPIPRPAPRIAAAVSAPAVVSGWRILRARGDSLDVEGRDGIYEVVPGAVLPGLGTVQSIERRDGRWMVQTPKGMIVSARDRGRFQDY